MESGLVLLELKIGVSEIVVALALKFLEVISSKPHKSILFHNTTMMSLRSISRALPRCLPRLAVQSQPRFLSTVHRTSLLQQTCKAASIPRFAAFSTSRAAREKEGQGMIDYTHIPDNRSLRAIQWTKSFPQRSSPSYNWRGR